MSQPQNKSNKRKLDEVSNDYDSKEEKKAESGPEPPSKRQKFVVRFSLLSSFYDPLCFSDLF
jgi:hypothetical protein